MNSIFDVLHHFHMRLIIIIIMIIIIMSLFYEDNILSTTTNLTYGPRLKPNMKIIRQYLQYIHKNMKSDNVSGTNALSV